MINNMGTWKAKLYQLKLSNNTHKTSECQNAWMNVIDSVTNNTFKGKSIDFKADIVD